MLSVKFSYTPTSGSASITVNGTTFPYAHQADGGTRASDARYASPTITTNTDITFTATSNGTPIHYRWDMGDGTILYGNPVIHRYLISNPELRVAVSAKDATDNETTTHQILSALSASRITVAERISVH